MNTNRDEGVETQVEPNGIAAKGPEGSGKTSILTRFRGRQVVTTGWQTSKV